MIWMLAARAQLVSLNIMRDFSVYLPTISRLLGHRQRRQSMSVRSCCPMFSYSLKASASFFCKGLVVR